LGGDVEAVPLSFLLDLRNCLYPAQIYPRAGFQGSSGEQNESYIVVSSFASSLLCTWFPIVPIISGAVLILAAGGAAGHAAGESLPIGVPLVAVSMGMETAFVDAVLMRWLLKESAKQFVRLLITNILNASIALALGLAWALHHLPLFIAALDNCC
jgi:hypothetical protein